MKSMLSLLTILSATSLALSSCLGDNVSEEKGTVTYGGSSCINVVTDLMTEESFVSTTPPSYKIEFNYTKGIAQIEMSNVQLAQNFSALSFQLPEQKCETDYYYTKIQATDVMPLNVTSQYVFSSLLLRYSNRIWNGNFWPVYQIRYTINSRYQVSVIPTSLLLFGTTTATFTPADADAAQADPYSYRGGERNIYNFTLAPNSIEEASTTGVTHTLTMKIQDACYDKDMQTIDLAFDKLPVSLNADGYKSVLEEGKKVTAKSNTGSVIEEIELSNFDLTTTLSGATKVKFDIKFADYRNFNGTFHVTAEIDNFITEEANGK